MQRSYRLCDKDDKYHSRTCKAVKQKAAEQMETVNAAPVTDQAVVTFWEKTYLPFAEENLRASTFIATNRFGPAPLDALWNDGTQRVQDPHGQSVPHVPWEKLGRRTIQHIRSLASGIFSHAANVGEHKTSSMPTLCIEFLLPKSTYNPPLLW